MTDKIDLVMWTKDGSRTLAPVLKQINSIIPQDFVNNRFIVDDASKDNTVAIAKSYGWSAIANKGKGISDGANTALAHVETKIFASFEQDLFLAPSWWQRISYLFTDSTVAVASGIRFVNYPLALKKIEEYSAERYKQQDQIGKYFGLFKTLDNTLYRTEVIRRIGGFPYLSSSIGVDQLLSQKVFQKGFSWKVDYSVQSVHLRNGLKGELAHNYWYGTHSDELNQKMSGKISSLRPMMVKFLFSPVRGLEIAIKKKAPESLVIYPLMRLSFLRGVVDGRRKGA